MDRVDAVVIGAGAVGLAVARALAQAGQETIVAEAQQAIGQGVSSRNSEVIHAGLYYAPGSLKAQLCVRGKELLYALCESHGVEHRRCGKLTVANSAEEVVALRALQERAAANGVPVEWLEGEQARAMEPALRCIAALHSPGTGIVDSHGFMLALQGDLERAGGAVALGSAVDGATLSRTAGEPHVLRLADGSELACGILVNAASLHACG
ncbi:MAG: FAD-dependent oxidoreductase, partial [Comamonadaceae bacterium]